MKATYETKAEAVEAIKGMGGVELSDGSWDLWPEGGYALSDGEDSSPEIVIKLISGRYALCHHTRFYNPSRYNEGAFLSERDVELVTIA